MYRWLTCGGLMLGMLWVIAGCAPAATPTPAPTAPPPPTETATPAPTATETAAAQPSATAVVTSTLPAPVGFALNKTQNAKSLRYQFETSVSITQDGKSQVIPGLSLNGTDSTLNRQVTISGTTSDTNEFITYEVIVLGDKVYLKGLKGVTGVDPAVWYELPADAQAGVRRLPSARGLLASFTQDDFSKGQFEQAGTETLDNVQCSIWSAKNGQFVLNLVGVTEGTELGKQVGVVDSSEFKLWTCADGYVHLMTGLVQGHSASNQNNTAAVNLRFVLSDLDQPLDIKAPDNTQPFPIQAQQPTAAPAENGPTVTPGPGATSPAPTITESGPFPTPTGFPVTPTPTPTP